MKEVGSGSKVGVRLSPCSWEYNECYDLDGVDATIALHVHLLKELNQFNLAYVHIVSSRIAGMLSIIASPSINSSAVFLGKVCMGYQLSFLAGNILV